MIIGLLNLNMTFRVIVALSQVLFAQWVGYTSNACLHMTETVFTGGGQTILSERSFSSFVQLCSLFPRSCYLCQTGIYRWSLSPSFGSSYVLSPCFVAPFQNCILGGVTKDRLKSLLLKGCTHTRHRERAHREHHTATPAPSPLPSAPSSLPLYPQPPSSLCHLAVSTDNGASALWRLRVLQH